MVLLGINDDVFLEFVLKICLMDVVLDAELVESVVKEVCGRR